MRISAALFFVFTGLAVAQPPPGGGPPGGGGPGASGDGIWVRNAYFGERHTFDACLGHQPGNGQYHHHAQPVCLRAQLNDNLEVATVGRTGTTYREKTSGFTHSPILGWAYDGYPIYGPYGYSDPANAKSAVRRIKSSFRLRSITARTSLPDWLLSYHNGVPQQLNTSQYGPAINATFPLGRYIEDFEWVSTVGDLDQYNGRFTVTPEFPAGTYAYFVTIDDTGAPAFPYIIGMQYYGTATTGNVTVPSDATDYFANGKLAGSASADPRLNSFPTKNSQQAAQVVIGWDPSAGPQTTWPGTQPRGASNASGGASTPQNADVQRIRSNAATVFVNSNDLPSYTIGPWFIDSNGGVFPNFPSAQNFLSQISRNPQAAAGARTSTGLGAVGVWVNGVAVFNVLDGGSYSATAKTDQGGGPVGTTAMHVSAASLEGGPVTAGSLVSAFALFDSVLATSTDTAPTPNWPTTLGGATVTIVDAAGVTFAAPIFYASPRQLNYRVPANVASGVATVRISANGATVTGGINVTTTYPGVFTQTADGLAAAQVAKLQNGAAVYTSVSASPITISNNATLILYATGLNGATDVKVSIGGVDAPVLYAGAQGTWAGLEQINVTIPTSLVGKGRADIVVTAGGKKSNPVYINLQ